MPYSSLNQHYQRLAKQSLSKHYHALENRFEHFSLCWEDWCFDYSKTLLDEEALKALIEWAQAADIEAYRSAMFNGTAINVTEQRSVLHTALRDADHPGRVNGQRVTGDIQSMYDHMIAFTSNVLSGQYASSKGQPFTDVINIGIGGSDLGPMMSTYALSPYRIGLRTHFIANLDPQNVDEIIQSLNPETTLVIVSSKSFTTTETMINAQAVKQWLESALSPHQANTHLAAVTSNIEAAQAFGIQSDRIFSYENWVGGRYSIWGAVGLPLMLSIGSERFSDFLAGAQSMDTHFQQAPLRENMPVLMGLIGAWHRNMCQYPTRALLVYDHQLKHFPKYVQQLDMESNGKRVDQKGIPLKYASGPIIWGGLGSNAQHSFSQWIHQGTDIVPCEFIIAAKPSNANRQSQHDLLVANGFAQSAALMEGRSYEKTQQLLQSEGQPSHHENKPIDVIAARSYMGNRPSTTLLYPQLTPNALGKLIALYEHRVFVEGCLWGINSFDQWGVELSKSLASQLLPAIRDTQQTAPKASQGLVHALHKLRQTNS